MGENLSITKTLPSSLDAEKAVLCISLTDNTMNDLIVSKLSVDDFYDPKNQIVYKAIKQIYAESYVIDITTVSNKLNDELQKIGGRTYLAEIVQEYASPNKTEALIDIILDKSNLRKLIRASKAAIDRAYQQDEPTSKLISSVESDIYKIGASSDKKEAKLIGTYFDEVLEMVEDYQTGNAKKHVRETGIYDLDKIVVGFGAELIVVGGNPGHGKTAFLLYLLDYWSTTLGVPTGMMSIEMTNKELAFRLLCDKSNIDSYTMRTKGGLSDVQMDKLVTVANQLYGSKIYSDDCSFQSAEEIMSKARRLKTKYNIQALGIDYLQLMKGDKGAQNREREISHISASLLAVSKELNIPVIALSQLSRDNVKLNRDPVPADLRDSGSLEQDAHKILFPVIMRDKDTREIKESKIIVAKNRNGRLGVVPMSFQDGRWANYTNREVPVNIY